MHSMAEWRSIEEDVPSVNGSIRTGRAYISIGTVYPPEESHGCRFRLSFAGIVEMGGKRTIDVFLS